MHRRVRRRISGAGQRGWRAFRVERERRQVVGNSSFGCRYVHRERVEMIQFKLLHCSYSSADSQRDCRDRGLTDGSGDRCETVVLTTASGAHLSALPRVLNRARSLANYGDPCVCGISPGTVQDRIG